jgi:hypothetical protein
MVWGGATLPLLNFSFVPGGEKYAFIRNSYPILAYVHYIGVDLEYWTF